MTYSAKCIAIIVNDASNPEITAHIYVDPHGLLDTKEHFLAEYWRPLALNVTCISTNIPAAIEIDQ